MFTEEAPGVFSVASRFVDGKNGIVVGDRWALAIDGSNYPDEGQAMATFIAEQGRAADRLILTHGHGDHILGAAPLSTGDVFGHVLTPPKIRSEIESHARKLEVSVAEVESLLPWPTVTFSEELRIDLGGKHAWVFPTPGHSEDGVSVMIEEERLLFAGDSVVNGIVSAIGDGNSEELEATLGELLELDIEVLVPGHGFTIHGQTAVRGWLRWQRSYLRAVRDRVNEALDGGATTETVADEVGFDAFIGDRLPKDRNGMPKRHRATVAKIVSEEVAWRGNDR